MYRRVADFVADYERESEGTLKLFRAIPDSAAAQAVVPGGRTLGRLAWHITCSVGEIARSAQLPGMLGPAQQEWAQWGMKAQL